MRAVDLGPVIGLFGQGALLAELAGTVGLGVVGWLVGIGCGTVVTRCCAGRCNAGIPVGCGRPTGSR